MQLIVKPETPSAALARVGQNIKIRTRYDNFIGGKWVAPVKGQYFENPTPITGKPSARSPARPPRTSKRRSTPPTPPPTPGARRRPPTAPPCCSRSPTAWRRTCPAMAIVETIDNGKPIRETMAADMPLAIDHFRYFAGCIRAQEGSLSEIDETTVAYHFHEPLGVVGQIIPWNFPLLMAVWKLAPALAAGNCVVLKPAEQTPMQHHGADGPDRRPPAARRAQRRQRLRRRSRQAAGPSPRIAKVAFTGETTTGRLIMQYASENIIPVTLELGGKSPNIFFADVLNDDDEFFDKALEGFTMFALNQGEVCTCPSRALVQETIYDAFMERAIERVKKVMQGNPLDPNTMIGAQASNDQLEKILSYIDIGKNEGAKVLTGGKRAQIGSRLRERLLRRADHPRRPQQDARLPGRNLRTGSRGHQVQDRGGSARHRQRHALRPRRRRLDARRHTAYRMGRGIKAGRVWTNCYHLYPAHAAFGGYKQSGIGREKHKMMLDHYQQTKNMLVSYSPKALGFF